MRLLDKALFRRFDDVLYYDFPSPEEIKKLIKNRLANFLGKLEVEEFVRHTKGLSHAEITQACYDSIKEAILGDKTTVSKKLLLNNLENRKSAYHHKER